MPDSPRPARPDHARSPRPHHDGSPAQLNPGEGWARDRWAAALLFAVALAARLFHLSEIHQNDPFFTIASVDGAIYDEWAREILGGDWRGDGVLYLGPLYPLFMALIYAITGPSLAALKAAQAILGAVSVVLVFGLARELFDRRVAIVAGAIASFYGMAIFYGGTVMIVNVQIPLVTGLVWAAIRALRDPTVARWALCGLLLGLSALARQTTLLLAPILGVAVLFARPTDFSLARRVVFGGVFALVVTSMILPFTIKNYVVGDDFVLLNSTGGANFYMGNQQGADGAWQPPSIGWPYRIDNPRAMRDAFTGVAQRDTGRSLAPSEVSSYWRKRGIEEILADPARWVRLEFRKLGLFLNAYEIWNNRSFEVSKRFSRVLRAPLVSFGLIAPFGLLGLALTLRRWRELIPIHGAIAAYLASALLFFVLSRYRMPATLLLIPFAAFAFMDLIDRVVQAVHTTRVRARAALPVALRVLALLLLAILVHLPLADENRMHMAYYNLGNKFRQLERFDEAILAYHESLATNPGAISTHNNLAIALEGAGRDDEAIAAWRRVRSLALRIGSERHRERADRRLAGLGASDPAEASSSAPAAEPARTD